MTARNSLLAVLAFVAACTGTNDRDPRQELAARNAPLREASLAPFMHSRIGDEALLRWLAQRTPCVVDGADAVDFVAGNESGSRGYGGFRNGTFVTSQFGCAVPIAPDGYLLTAAHCIASGIAVVTATLPGRPTREGSAIVVWRGDQCDPPIDLAVIQVPGLQVPPLAWAPLAAASPGAGVVVCGAGNTAIRVAGGTIAAAPVPAPAAAGTPAFAMLSVHVPVIPGDSGGPCALADGTLLGVISTGSHGDGKPRATVLRPDPNWLADVVARHRATRRAAAAAATRPSAAAWVRTQAIDAEVERVLRGF